MASSSALALQDMHLYNDRTIHLEKNLCCTHKRDIEATLAQGLSDLMTFPLFQERVNTLLGSASRSDVFLGISVSNRELVVKKLVREASGALRDTGESNTIDSMVLATDTALSARSQQLIRDVDHLYQQCINPLHSHPSSSGSSSPSSHPGALASAARNPLDHMRDLEREIDRLRHELESVKRTLPFSSSITGASASVLPARPAVHSIMGPSAVRGEPSSFDTLHECLNIADQFAQYPERTDFRGDTISRFGALPEEVQHSTFFEMYQLRHAPKRTDYWEYGRDFFYNQNGQTAKNRYRAHAIQHYVLNALVQHITLGSPKEQVIELFNRLPLGIKSDVYKHLWLIQDSSSKDPQYGEKAFHSNDFSIMERNLQRADAIRRCLSERVADEHKETVSILQQTLSSLQEELAEHMRLRAAI